MSCMGRKSSDNVKASIARHMRMPSMLAICSVYDVFS